MLKNVSAHDDFSQTELEFARFYSEIPLPIHDISNELKLQCCKRKDMGRV